MNIKNLIPLVAIAASPYSQAMTTIFSDDFSDGNRNGWYYFTSGGTTSEISGNAYRYNTTTTSGGQNGAAITYFTPTTLTIGQILTFSFEVSAAIAGTNQNEGLRYGIFNSGGTGISTDLAVSNNTAFNNDVGYAGFSSFGSGDTVTSTKRRNSGVSNTFWTNGAYSTLKSATDATGNNSNNTPYLASLTLTYTAVDSMTVSSTFGSVTNTEVVTSPITTFDSVSIFAQGINGAVTIDNVLVTVVPEPSSFLLGAIGSLALLRRRR